MAIVPRSDARKQSSVAKGRPWLERLTTGGVGGVLLFLSLPGYYEGALFWTDRLNQIHPALGAFLFLIGAWLVGYALKPIEHFFTLCGFTATLVQDVLSALFARASSTLPACQVYGFIRVPEGQEPPAPAYRMSRKGLRPRRPWVPSLPAGQDPAWLSVAFAGRKEGNFRIHTPVIRRLANWDGAYYSHDGHDGWHDERTDADNYVRYRLDDSHLTAVIPLGRAVSEWVEILNGPLVEGRNLHDPFDLDCIKELRAYVSFAPSEGLVNFGRFEAEATFQSLSSLPTIIPSTPDNEVGLVLAVSRVDRRVSVTVGDDVPRVRRETIRILFHGVSDEEHRMVNALDVRCTPDLQAEKGSVLSLSWRG